MNGPARLVNCRNINESIHLLDYQNNLEFSVNLLLLPCQFNSQNQELENMLRRATMPDRTVILTMVDESVASPGSLLDILLQSFKSGEGTQRLVNHLVIITMDLQAFEYCRSLHPYCIHPSVFPHPFATIMTTPANKLFTWTRKDVLFEVVRLGYNIIFTVRLLISFL